mgnify:CR=1 FL=1|tara:strand:- start:734 stop:940 length:207 start_codon:yes stop_codon:yes gene_type:complete
MTTKQTVSHLKSKLNEIEKELNSIQENCNHSSTITRFDKQNQIKLYCADCDKELGMPSSQQVQEFLNK